MNTAGCHITASRRSSMHRTSLLQPVHYATPRRVPAGGKKVREVVLMLTFFPVRHGSLDPGGGAREPAALRMQ